MRLLLTSCLIGLMSLTAHAARSPHDPTYPLHYQVTLNPEHDRAEVSIESDHRGLLELVDFNISSGRYSQFESNGDLTIEKGRAIWEPPEDETARISFHARISHERDPGEYDALITEDYALFRGDNLIPTARVRTDGKAYSMAYLQFTLPDHWTSVRTGWDKRDDNRFRIDNPERRFDRPTGWMIAGVLGTRVEQLGDTTLVVSAPRDSGFRRMDVVALVTNVWPEIEKAFGTTPPKFTIIGQDDPFWRGALSGPNGLFLHADRPMVSENGTSTVIHELVHVVTGIDSSDRSDWIVEGLAEYYAVELMARSGAFTESRREKVMEDLADWGEEVKSLRTASSASAVTARAVVLLDALDREIRDATDGSSNLDQVVRALVHKKDVTTEHLRQIAEEVLGHPSQTLDTPLLKLD